MANAKHRLYELSIIIATNTDVIFQSKISPLQFNQMPERICIVLEL